MVVYVTSEANLKNLEVNRQNTRKIADPRGLTEADAQKLIATTKPHYHISAGLHSGETNPPEAVIELAYRLAVSEEPYIKQIRDNVIVSITGTTDVDGRDRYVDWYYAYKIDEAYDGGENYGGPPYWGKYVFHDNNRDINYGVDSLRAHLNWYLNWVPPIWHDVHEAQTLLYTFSGQPPQNANLDPILYTELPFFASYEVNKLTAFGMPGVWHFGFVDMWSPGYLGFAAANHNGMLRMYEVFNQGGANTKKARLSGNQLTRQWYRPNPATAGEVDWSIRNSINYSQTGLLTALELTSKFPTMVVENYYKKSANAVKKGAEKPPHAFVIPAGQRDQSQVDRVANLLRRQAIEVHRATAEIKVKEGAFPAGSYIVKLNQPVRSARQDADRKAELSGSGAHHLRRQRVVDGDGEQHRRQDHRGQDHPRRGRDAAQGRCDDARIAQRSERRHRRQQCHVYRFAQRRAEPHHAALSAEGRGDQGRDSGIQGWRSRIPRRLAVDSVDRSRAP